MAREPSGASLEGPSDEHLLCEVLLIRRQDFLVENRKSKDNVPVYRSCLDYKGVRLLVDESGSAVTAHQTKSLRHDPDLVSPRDSALVGPDAPKNDVLFAPNEVRVGEFEECDLPYAMVAAGDKVNRWCARPA